MHFFIGFVWWLSDQWVCSFAIVYAVYFSCGYRGNWQLISRDMHAQNISWHRLGVSLIVYQFCVSLCCCMCVLYGTFTLYCELLAYFVKSCTLKPLKFVNWVIMCMTYVCMYASFYKPLFADDIPDHNCDTADNFRPNPLRVYKLLSNVGWWHCSSTWK